MATFSQTFMDKIDSGSTIIWVYLNGDEGRAERQIKQLVEIYNKQADNDLQWHSWNNVAGATWDSKVLDPQMALLQCRDQIGGNALILMKDLHKYLNGEGPKNLSLRRALSELCTTHALCNDKQTRVICLLSDTPTPHPCIAEYCDVIDYDLPTYDEMEVDVVDFILDSVKKGNKGKKAAKCAPELKEKVVRSLLGTTAEEAARIFAFAVATCGGLNDGVLNVIAAEKAKVIRKIDGLRFIPNEHIPDVETVGGFSRFLEWLRRRARAYTRHARTVKLSLPRGAVLIGPPGTGKTHVAKTAAKALGLDLVLLDIGSMFDKYVGGSEAKIRDALAMVKAMPNAFLMVDEIDKSFGGAHEGQAADSGVASRVLSYFLNWLSERDMGSDENRTFVMVTMNRTAGVPEELLRPGRFDRVWSTDLPTPDERAEILKIHLRLQHCEPDNYDKHLKRVVTKTNEYTGAELEETVISARNDAYDDRMSAWEDKGKKGTPPGIADIEPTIEELMAAAAEISPVSRLNVESVTAIRKFCQENTYPVNGERLQNTTKSRAARGVSTRRSAAKSDPANN